MQKEGPPVPWWPPGGSRDQPLSASPSLDKKDWKERYSPVFPVKKKCELRHSPGRDFDSYRASQSTQGAVHMDQLIDILVEAVTEKLLRDTQVT
jgi:hypothetical protein